jgi:hypothetical protein
MRTDVRIARDAPTRPDEFYFAVTPHTNKVGPDASKGKLKPSARGTGLWSLAFDQLHH